ncbi:MAG: MoxR family ATPase [Acidiferrobacterales bacterium]|nr:MoxR family ATPase [Acidiferrobacterales bacterium]
MGNNDALLNDFRLKTLELSSVLSSAILGQERAIKMICLSLFTRGHVLLEGDVGVGKTTLLKAVSQCIGGNYARIEGTIDLVPSDLVYYTFLDENGKPRVDPGPILKHGEELTIFFFNEINRARPQVHSVLLRVMAEHEIQAFNRLYRLPYVQVFADRNSLEKEETFELPSAAKDRFLMELSIAIPEDRAIQRELMVNPRFHDTDTLIGSLPGDLLSYLDLDQMSLVIQNTITISETLQNYILDLCQGTRTPSKFGIHIDSLNVDTLIQAGVSPRGMSMLTQVVRANAWLAGRDYVVPEDIHDVLTPMLAHRIMLKPIYEMQRQEIIPELMESLVNKISTP